MTLLLALTHQLERFGLVWFYDGTGVQFVATWAHLEVLSRDTEIIYAGSGWQLSLSPPTLQQLAFTPCWRACSAEYTREQLHVYVGDLPPVPPADFFR
ncbi:MAG: hypothetical protein Q7P63_14760 [Verrucomicrobiota bacterium JB022]|nr:hypothetical protein [Verrucomicrobiota bacterium JB022]